MAHRVCRTTGRQRHGDISAVKVVVLGLIMLAGSLAGASVAVAAVFDAWLLDFRQEAAAEGISQ